MHQPLRRVGILFSGGPAPAANAVIGAAALSLLDSGREVFGFFHGYTNLQDYSPARPLVAGEHFLAFQPKDLVDVRNSRGILIGTARANPGKAIRGPDDLGDPERTSRLHNVLAALRSLEVDALISIGGDDTLKTANYLYRVQDLLPPGERRVRVVHLPKTIDNDYRGIDFTFGFFTAVDFMAKELENLRADARATSSWFLVETMGRKAGWLSYGVGIAGEANRVIGLEDIEDAWMTGTHLDPVKLADHLVDVMLLAERRGQHHGVIVIAEGLAELLPPPVLGDVTRDDHGHLSLGAMDLGKLMAAHVSDRYEQRQGRAKKLRGVQLGYEARCAPPHAFDVMLGSQLGIGAFRALVEEGLDGHMVSVTGQLDLTYVPFAELIDPDTLITEVRYIRRGSDFHKLARFLESRAGEGTFDPGPRKE